MLLPNPAGTEGAFVSVSLDRHIDTTVDAARVDACAT
jgi:hypothetical protein